MRAMQYIYLILGLLLGHIAWMFHRSKDGKLRLYMMAFFASLSFYGLFWSYFIIYRPVGLLDFISIIPIAIGVGFLYRYFYKHTK